MFEMLVLLSCCGYVDLCGFLCNVCFGIVIGVGVYVFLLWYWDFGLGCWDVCVYFCYWRIVSCLWWVIGGVCDGGILGYFGDCVCNGGCLRKIEFSICWVKVLRGLVGLI